MSVETEKDQELIEFAYKELNIKLPKGNDVYEKMISGMFYDCYDKDIHLARERAHQLAREYARIEFEDDDIETYSDKRLIALKSILGRVNTATIEAPFYVDFGFNIYLGDNFYANFNLTILDCSVVKFGNDCMCGPNVTITAATHSIDPIKRATTHGEWAKKVIIGNNVWLGANVTVLAGVTIGDGVVICAGSLVNKDIPAYSVAVGTPAKVVKKLEGY